MLLGETGMNLGEYQQISGAHLGKQEEKPCKLKTVSPNIGPTIKKIQFFIQILRYIFFCIYSSISEG